MLYNLSLIEKLKINLRNKRVTISLIGSKLGIRGLLEKHLDKMPLTKQYLDSMKRSRRDFQLGRAKWAVQELKRKGEIPKLWKVLRKAGIKKEFCQDMEYNNSKPYTILQ